MQQIKFFLIISLIILIQPIYTIDYCGKTKLALYCEDGYKCCENDSYYWCCAEFARECGSQDFYCPLSIGMIIIILILNLVFVIGIILAIVCCVRRHRRIQQSQVIMSRPVYAVQQQAVMVPMYNQQPYGYQNQQPQIYEGVPLQSEVK